MIEADILRKAAEIVETPGVWGRGEHPNGDQCCALEAIQRAHPYIDPARSRAIEALRQRVCGDFGLVGEWNDFEATDAAEVAANMRAAADKLEGKTP